MMHAPSHGVGPFGSCSAGVRAQKHESGGRAPTAQAILYMNHDDEIWSSHEKHVSRLEVDGIA